MCRRVCLVVFAVVMLITTLSYADGLLSNPETVVFDSIGNRYLVSNWSGGSVVAIAEDGNQTYFRTGLGSAHALHILDGILYVGGSNRVFALDLGTSHTVAQYILDGAQMIKGLTSDTSGNIYATNFGTAKSIYQIDLSADRVTKMVSFPHYIFGITFDSENNRLIVPASFDDCEIQSVSLPGAAVSTICSTDLDKPFGICRDGLGNYYISMWSMHSVYRFDPTLTEPPVLVSDDFVGPEGLCYNLRDNILAVPDWDMNIVKFLQPMVSIETDQSFGEVPLDVSFSGIAEEEVISWEWNFGDGGTSEEQSPIHQYDLPGRYTVSLQVDFAAGGSFLRTVNNCISVLADTIQTDTVGTIAGGIIAVPIYAVTTVPAYSITVPFEYSSGDLEMIFDSFSTVGLRTEYLGGITYRHVDPGSSRYTLKLAINSFAGEPLIPAGDGAVVNLYFTVSGTTALGESVVLDLDGYGGYLPTVDASMIGEYYLAAINGLVICDQCCRKRADLDRNGGVLIDDLTFMVDYLFASGISPECIEEADVNGSGEVNIADLTYFVEFLFGGGDPPPGC